MNLSDIWLANIEIVNLLWKGEIFNMQQKNKKQKKKEIFPLDTTGLRGLKAEKLSFSIKIA